MDPERISQIAAIAESIQAALETHYGAVMSDIVHALAITLSGVVLTSNSLPTRLMGDYHEAILTAVKAQLTRDLVESN